MSLIVQREDIARFEPEWRDLARRCVRRSAFLSPVWLKCWWDEFGDGNDLMLLAVRDGSELVGVAPLMRDGASLTFAGDTRSATTWTSFAAPAGSGPSSRRSCALRLPMCHPQRLTLVLLFGSD